MPSEQEVLSQINALENKLGVQQNFISEADVFAKINAMEERIARKPLSIDEFVEKWRMESSQSTSEKALAFGGGLVEGVKGMVKEGGEALDEVPWYWITGVGALKDYETVGDIVNIGARDFKRFAKTLGGSIMDKLGPYSTQEEIHREYKRYRRTLTTMKRFAPRCLKAMILNIRK